MQLVNAAKDGGGLGRAVGGNAVPSHRTKENTKDARDPFGTELLGACLLACLVAFGHVIEHGKRFFRKHFTFQT